MSLLPLLTYTAILLLCCVQAAWASELEGGSAKPQTHNERPAKNTPPPKFNKQKLLQQQPPFKRVKNTYPRKHNSHPIEAKQKPKIEKEERELKEANQKLWSAFQRKPSSTSLDVCFVHVGKTGGGTIWHGIRNLMKSNVIANSVSLHAKVFYRDRDLDTFVSFNTSKVRTRIMRSGNVRSGKDMHKAQRIACMYPNRESLNSCNSTGHVLLWVRDPISRLVSTWNFVKNHSSQSFVNASYANVLEAAGKVGVSEIMDAEDGLNMLVETMARRKHTGLEDLFTVLKAVNHATTDIAFYLGNKTNFPTSWADKSANCKEVLDRLPVFFVGREENMVEDWNMFVKKASQGMAQAPQLEHVHQTSVNKHQLSNLSVLFLRKFYQADFECINDMVERGWIDRDYYPAITSQNNVYKF
eukprot:CAMPEP_0181307066 /NCGR_PEP_ID=MMETSP1101-20121128/10657_1 /TAXON_ID=46948 /ORGANISM="Rhodomonas abbreviata, Strain Caron Lab Isolate" /LENGTH=412 /DNA_ID=CAMNT_0023413209 /DNA_START=350 /DNA_END=1588 /DNA_ORIENTATION=+